MKEFGTRLERIYKHVNNGSMARPEPKQVGVELLLLAESIQDKESFFDRITPAEDKELFIMHLQNFHEAERASAVDSSTLAFVNLKPETLLMYHKEIADQIERLGLRNRVVIEIREDNISREDLKRLLTVKQEHELFFSIDDFGSASSNLDRLKRLKPEFVKIEITLFDTAHELISLVKFLRLSTPKAKLIAEKVENEVDFKKVSLAFCDMWQGYYDRVLFCDRTKDEDGE